MDIIKQVKVDPNLLKNKELSQVYYLPDQDIKWYLLSNDPAGYNIDEYTIVSVEDVLVQFPEFQELYDLDIGNKQVMFKKGINSNKWYDFV